MLIRGKKASRYCALGNLVPIGVQGCRVQTVPARRVACGRQTPVGTARIGMVGYRGTGRSVRSVVYRPWLSRMRASSSRLARS